ncbi:MAG: hypothetical protein IGS38_20695 [Synechococcales cyanobacterium M58_A2018_015]|nr:hypothetical protein [Synechococcales cyanobacterium M58_A2018_015]
MRLNRSKTCVQCQQVASVLYRVRYDESEQWRFVCPVCLPAVKIDNPHYTYGGTWKAKKKR